MIKQKTLHGLTDGLCKVFYWCFLVCGGEYGRFFEKKLSKKLQIIGSAVFCKAKDAVSDKLKFI